MRLLRLLIAGCLLALIPAHTSAGPRTAPFSCDLAQLIDDLPFPSRYNVQFIGHMTVNLEDTAITLRVCAPAEVAANAQSSMETLADVLPSMSKHSGLAYQGPLERTVVLVSHDELPVGANGAGASMDEEGSIWLDYDPDLWDVVHVGAYFWANTKHFGEPWMVRGYAGYLAELALADLGQPVSTRQPTIRCDDVLLPVWDGVNDPDGCRSAVATAVFRDLAGVVGESRIRAAVAALSRGSRTITSPALFDALEESSQIDLAPIMRGRVFQDQQLEERRILWKQLGQARALADALDVDLPPEIGQAVDHWDFVYAAAWMSPLLPLLESAAAIDGRCDQLNLGCGSRRLLLPATPEEATAMGRQLDAVKTMLDRYAALRDNAAEFDLSPPASLFTRVAALQLEAEAGIRRAQDILIRVRLMTQLCQQMSASCAGDWRDAWSMGQLDETERKITAQIDFLQSAADVEELCGNDMRDICRQTWQKKLHLQDVASAQDALNLIKTILKDAGALEQSDECGAWNCAAAWRAVFKESADPAKVSQLLQSMHATLPVLREADQIALLVPPFPVSLLDTIVGSNPTVLLAEAHTTFAKGDLENAQRLAKQAIDAQANTSQRHMMMGSLLIVLALGILVALIARRRSRRRPAAVPPANSALLLNELLSQPPEGKSK